MWQDSPGRERRGSFHDTAETISTAARAGSVNGSITTSWDDSGLHNQMWMPRFVCAGAYSWNADGPCVDRWTRVFFANYFGPEATDVRELFGLLQDCSQFWYDTFQRRVWHWGDVGKVTLPDLPRGDLEYSSHWKRRYAQMLNAARDERFRLDRARFIIDENLSRDATTSS